MPQPTQDAAPQVIRQPCVYLDASTPQVSTPHVASVMSVCGIGSKAAAEAEAGEAAPQAVAAAAAAAQLCGLGVSDMAQAQAQLPPRSSHPTPPHCAQCHDDGRYACVIMGRVCLGVGWVFGIRKLPLLTIYLDTGSRDGRIDKGCPLKPSLQNPEAHVAHSYCVHNSYVCTNQVHCTNLYI